MIYAVSPGGVIGGGGTLPWRYSADLKRFKRLTTVLISAQSDVAMNEDLEWSGRIVSDIVLNRWGSVADISCCISI